MKTGKILLAAEKADEDFIDLRVATSSWYYAYYASLSSISDAGLDHSGLVGNYGLGSKYKPIMYSIQLRLLLVVQK